MVAWGGQSADLGTMKPPVDTGDGDAECADVEVTRLHTRVRR